MLELTEKIDAYLTGDLSEFERVEFENAISSDPSLKAEVDFQRDVLDGIREFRKSQLKARLNNIDVSAGTSNSTLFKYAASIVAAASIGAGILYFTNNNNNENPVEDNTPSLTVVDNNSDGSIQNSESSSSESSDVASKKDKDKKKKGASDSETNKGSLSTPSNDLTKPVEPNFNMPSENFTKSEDEINVTSVEVPTGDIAKGAVKGVKGISKVEERHDKNVKELSYQYYNNELYLYGDFDARPYELIEYNSNKRPRLFVKFDGAIYELKSNTTKPTPMKEVTDTELLDQLKHGK